MQGTAKDISFPDVVSVYIVLHSKKATYDTVSHLLATSPPIMVPALSRQASRPAWSTLGRPHAVALRFARRDQLATGLAPVGVRPCWAHKQKPHPVVRDGVFRKNSKRLFCSRNYTKAAAILAAANESAVIPEKVPTKVNSVAATSAPDASTK